MSRMDHDLTAPWNWSQKVKKPGSGEPGFVAERGARGQER